ncbi:hypothetical protein VNO77_04588 [Canavalia gladiata]|uniref:Uncharacterized protein n=1 Tax=Canavalia gladiata TaxID=3824 RepID=A0AAN9MWS9_CANGL
MVVSCLVLVEVTNMHGEETNTLGSSKFLSIVSLTRNNKVASRSRKRRVGFRIFVLLQAYSLPIYLKDPKVAFAVVTNLRHPHQDRSKDPCLILQNQILTYDFDMIGNTT